MKSFIKFIAGWFITYPVFAVLCLLGNLKTMDYADCLNNGIVQGLALFLGWIAGGFWAISNNK